MADVIDFVPETDTLDFQPEPEVQSMPKVSVSPYDKLRQNTPMGPFGPLNPSEVLSLPQVLKAPAAVIENTGIGQSLREIGADFLNRTGINPAAQADEPLAPKRENTVYIPSPLEEAFPNATRGAEEALRGFTTPDMLLLAPAMGLKPVQAAFEAQMLSGVPQSVESLAGASNAQEETKALIEAGLGLGAGLKLAKGHPKVDFVPEETKAPEQVPPAGEAGEAQPSAAPGGATVEAPVTAGATPQANAEVGTPPEPKQVTNVTPDVTEQSLTGMGGAVPSEFDPTSATPTSTKNAQVDVERAQRGLPPAIQPIRKAFGEVWDRAMALVDHDPEVIDNLLDSLRSKPRALTDTENALLLHRQVDLQNEYGKATRDLAQAFDDGRADAVASEKIRVANLSDKLQDVYDIGKKVGTETGRGLAARRMLANEDFTLAHMEMDVRGAKGGAPLTDAERAQMNDLHGKIEATQKAYDEYRASSEARFAESEARRVVAEALAKSVPSFDKRVIRHAENIVSKMENAAKSSSEKLRELLARTSAGVDPTILYHASIVGAAKIARAGLDLAKFTDEMVRDFGEKIKPIIADVWRESNRIVDENTKDAPDRVKRAVRQTESTDIKESTTKSIAENVASGEKDKITWLVNKLARGLIKSGITDREALINQVHGVLQDAIPGITRREAMDAISGYGDYKQLSKDQITVKLRGLKGEMQQLAKLEDMAKGEPPLKSGVERRTPTEAERKLIKEVNDAKRKFQVPVADPETQLKSSLDTLKTTLKNRITDYEDRIARGDFATRPREPLKLDPEATRLQAANERVKKQFQRGVALERLKNAGNLERAGNWVVKWRRGFILSGPVTLAKLTSAAVQRALITPAEEAIGSAIGRVIPSVASKAAREGGFNVKAEAKAVTEGLTQGMRDAWQTLKTGQSDLDVLYGKAALLPPTAIDFFGHVHGALKAPVKRAEFARSFEKRSANAIANGVDVSDPMVQSGLVVAAYKDANRSIFLQDNRVVGAYQSALQTLERRDKATGEIPLAGKAGATAARVLLPIVKVPLNIVAETLQNATGLVTGSARLGRAFSRGIENLKPEEADLIMRSLKKGSLGAAVMTLGFLNPQVVGGYYQPGEKRKAGDVKAGGVKIFGVNIPSFLLHNPLLETMQIGATLRRVAESKFKKSDTEPQGLGAGAIAAARGVAEQVPFVRETTAASHLMDPRQSTSFWYDLAKSLVIPEAVQSVARFTDKDKYGNPIQRKPGSTLQAIETGIPGLRETVPQKPKK